MNKVNIGTYWQIKHPACSDPSFGATMAIVPEPTLSMAFLPAAYGSVSDVGMGITVKFPNSSMIFTSNSPAGVSTIDADGNKPESTSLLTNNAISAIGQVDNSTEPGRERNYLSIPLYNRLHSF